jgi:hypothetical protein
MLGFIVGAIVISIGLGSCIFIMVTLFRGIIKGLKENKNNLK